MNQVFLCLGGNKGDVVSTFSNVINYFAESIGVVEKKSSVYQTAAWGDENQDDYLNQVIQINTKLTPDKLLENCLHIEQKYGRFRDKNNQWASRSIDIDILLYSNQQIVEKNLIIPHPRMLQRNFVMIPLAEIAGEIIHPIINKKISDLVLETKDSLKVKCIITT